MRTAIGVALLLAGVGAQTPPQSEVRIRLFLIERPVGIERVSVTTTGDRRTQTSDVEYVDRGTRVQLRASLTTTADAAPVHFQSKGRSYRFVNVDTEVAVAGGVATVATMGQQWTEPAPVAWFPARSWAPVAMRASLIAHWERLKRPAELVMLPGDPDSRIRVVERGEDTVMVNGRRVSLRRFSVDGVVWGRETVWIDGTGAFAALVSRVHILPLEAVREDLGDALPALQVSAVRDRMADLAAFERQTRPIAEGAFALVGARLITGLDAPPIDDGVVVVRGGRIATIGRRDQVTLSPGTLVIDVAGKTIIPGLWDTHAHASQIEWAPAYLAAGVTHIRDMGGESAFLTAFRDAMAPGRGVGPQLSLAGLVDGPGDGGFGVVIASTPEGGRAIVDRYRAAGFRQIKLYSLVQPAVVQAITARAHEHGMTVTGHVPTALGLEAAVQAGMDQIAHLSVRAPGTPDSDRVLALLASRRVAIDPTRAWSELLSRPQGVTADAVEPGMALAPYSLAANYRSVTNGPARAATTSNGPSILKVLLDKGIPILAGTDGALPGHSLLRELELYVEAGFTPLQAIQSATRVPAQALGLANDVGTLEAGRRADLVVLDANPLDDIGHIRRTRFVMTRGRLYDPAPLWRLASFRAPIR